MTTSTLDWIAISPLILLEFSESSSWRIILSDSVGIVGVVPLPLHCEQVLPVDSAIEFIKRWRDNSSRPNLDIVPIWTRARSLAVAFSIAFSIATLYSSEAISMKLITIKPPISLSRNWIAITSTASRFALKAVSSILAPLVARAELISIAVNASVASNTIAAPDLSVTSLLKTFFTCDSTFIWANKECSVISKYLIRSR